MPTKPLDLTPEQRTAAIKKTNACLAEAAEVAKNLRTILEPSISGWSFLPGTDASPAQERLDITALVLQSIGESALTADKHASLVPGEQLRYTKAVLAHCLRR